MVELIEGVLVIVVEEVIDTDALVLGEMANVVINVKILLAGDKGDVVVDAADVCKDCKIVVMPGEDNIDTVVGTMLVLGSPLVLPLREDLLSAVTEDDSEVLVSFVIIVEVLVSAGVLVLVEEELVEAMLVTSAALELAVDVLDVKTDDVLIVVVLEFENVEVMVAGLVIIDVLEIEDVGDEVVGELVIAVVAGLLDWVVVALDIVAIKDVLGIDDVVEKELVDKVVLLLVEDAVVVAPPKSFIISCTA